MLSTLFKPLERLPAIKHQYKENPVTNTSESLFKVLSQLKQVYEDLMMGRIMSGLREGGRSSKVRGVGGPILS